MKIGNSVRYVGDNENLKGKTGILRKSARGYAAVEFSEPIEGGHDIGGYCQDGHGLYVPLSEIVKVSRFNVGDTAIATSNKMYGEEIFITGIVDTPGDENIYRVSVNGKEVDLYEEYIAKKEEYIPAPFKVGDLVVFNPQKRGEIFNQLFDLIGKRKLEPVMISQIKIVEGEFYVQIDQHTEKYLSSDFFMPYVESEVVNKITQFETLCNENISYPPVYAYSDSEQPWQKLVTVLADMLLAFSDEKLQQIQSISDFESRFCINFVKIDRSIRTDGIKGWLINKECAFLCCQNENTFDDLVQLYKDEGTLIEKSNNKTWLRTKDTMVFFFDQFDFVSTINALMEAIPKVYGENSIYPSLVEGNYELAIDLYVKYLEKYNKKKEEVKRLAEIENVLSGFRESFLSEYLNKEDLIKNRIRDYEDALRGQYKSLRDIQLNIVGVRLGNNDGEMNTFSQFLQSMGERLVKISCPDDGAIEIQLIQEWVYFDEDLYTTCDIRRQYCEEGYNPIIFELLDDIILKRKYGLLLEETARVNSEGRIKCLQYDSARAQRDVKTGIPNPHHSNYNCWGNHESPIAKSYTSGQYTASLSQIIAAVGGINMADGAVIERFLHTLHELSHKSHEYWSNNKCVINKTTGKTMTVHEYACEKEAQEKEKNK